MVDLGGKQGRTALPLGHGRGREGEGPELLRGLLWGAEVDLHQVLGHCEACQPTCLHQARKSVASTPSPGAHKLAHHLFACRYYM